MIVIVDYGLGNIRAFSNMYKRMNVEARVAHTATELEGATRLILPGVGAFDHAMQLLQGSGMRPTLDKMVLERQVPVLGICVGMQIMADSSDEGSLAGLGWIPGRVRAFRDSEKVVGLALPHMGWNDVRPAPGNPLFAGLESDARFYFLHSYHFDCQQAECRAATTHYGFDFACAVRSGHIHGVQFHPEKSHHFGARLLKNLADI